MKADSIKFRGHRCFRSNWAGFDTIKPLNLIIGRNNTGKSQLLDLVEALCTNRLAKRGWNFSCRGVLDQATLKTVFQTNVSGGELGGEHWGEHGRHFVNVPIAWESDDHLRPIAHKFPDGFKIDSPLGDTSTKHRTTQILSALSSITHALSGRHFSRLLADRDIQSEPAQNELNLASDGAGATNIIRRHITTSSLQYPRELIQTKLLTALNTVFGPDGQFTEIQVKHHDEALPGRTQGHWEVYLGESKKGLIPLSNSGSGLKTAILILLQLLVVPDIVNRPKAQCVFAIEEPENNLHPALLRRLLRFVDEYSVTEGSVVFLTSHSSTALDMCGMSNNAQILHITHDGESASVKTVSAHFDHLGVVSELGARPSDLLQANGIVWVEGPSDCVYMNRLISLFSNGDFQEGRDYQCAFYGGALLARTQFSSPEDAEAELINLLRLNPNIVVVCDGDRTALSGEGSFLKGRVARIRDEVSGIPGGYCWITEAKEIENYLPGSVIGAVCELTGVPDPGKYEAFFPSMLAADGSSSFIETHLKRKGMDKMNLAIQSSRHLTKENLSSRFDLAANMLEIVSRIRAWAR